MVFDLSVFILLYTFDYTKKMCDFYQCTIAAVTR